MVVCLGVQKVMERVLKYGDSEEASYCISCAHGSELDVEGEEESVS
jgi:hypothetical protein